MTEYSDFLVTYSSDVRNDFEEDTVENFSDALLSFADLGWRMGEDIGLSNSIIDSDSYDLDDDYDDYEDEDADDLCSCHSCSLERTSLAPKTMDEAVDNFLRDIHFS